MLLTHLNDDFETAALVTWRLFRL